MKKLGYPFGVSKTALVAVGSPHTWPALLAMITWLVELITYDEEARMAKEQKDGLDDPETLFFAYLAQAYGTFLSGDDEQFQQVSACVGYRRGPAWNLTLATMHAARRVSRVRVRGEVQAA